MGIFRREEARDPGGSPPDDAANPSGAKRSDGRDLLDFVAARVGTVVDAASLAATDIRSEADSQRSVGGDPTMINRERLVFELAVALAERADQLSRDAAALEGLLGRARDRLDTVADPSRPLGSHPREGADSAFDEEASSGHQEDAPATIRWDRPAVPGNRFKSKPTSGRERAHGGNGVGAESRASAEALELLATQMAVAGSGRAEIERRLRDEHGVEDAGAILARVLGPRA